LTQNRIVIPNVKGFNVSIVNPIYGDNLRRKIKGNGYWQIKVIYQ